MDDASTEWTNYLEAISKELDPVSQLDDKSKSLNQAPREEDGNFYIKYPNTLCFRSNFYSARIILVCANNLIRFNRGGHCKITASVNKY